MVKDCLGIRHSRRFRRAAPHVRGCGDAGCGHPHAQRVDDCHPCALGARAGAVPLCARRFVSAVPLTAGMPVLLLVFDS